MTKIEEKIYQVFIKINTLLTQYKKDITPIENLKKNADEFKQRMVTLRKTDMLYSSMRKKAITDKQTMRLKLVDKTLIIANCLHLVAKEHQNTELMEKSKLTRTKLRVLKDHDLLIPVEELFQEAAQRLEELGPYGLSHSVYKDCTTALEFYKETLHIRDETNEEAKKARAALTIQFREIRALLTEDISRMMEIFKDSKKEFYKEFKELVKLTAVSVYNAKKAR